MVWFLIMTSGGGDSSRWQHARDGVQQPPRRQRRRLPAHQYGSCSKAQRHQPHAAVHSLIPLMVYARMKSGGANSMTSGDVRCIRMEPPPQQQQVPPQVPPQALLCAMPIRQWQMDASLRPISINYQTSGTQLAQHERAEKVSARRTSARVVHVACVRVCTRMCSGVLRNCICCVYACTHA